MNKQEVIEKIEKEKSPFNSWEDLNRNNALDVALDIVEKLDESAKPPKTEPWAPEKPVVPKFVGEWIEDHKGDYNKWDEEARADFVFRAINDLFRFGDGLNPWDFTIYKEFSDWTTENAYEFITAILFDYTVKKEKLYTVEIPNPNLNAHTILQKTGAGIILVTVGNTRWKGWESSKLTEAEIKQDFDFLWPFAEEVEE